MLLKIIFFYTSKNIGQIRQSYNLKMCYKKHLTFLKLKQTKGVGLARRLTKNGNYMRSLKDLHFFFIFFLRSNVKNENIKSQFFNLSTTNKNYFITNYNQYLALNDINRVLL